MGFLNIFGGTPPEKAKKLKNKVLQKYGDPSSRQKAIAQLGQLKCPEAVGSLLARFTVSVEPSTVDQDEKDQVFELIRSSGRDAVEPIKEFLLGNDLASSWAVRLLSSLLPEPEAVGTFIEMLEKVGAGYVRNPEKKLVLIHHLTGKDDPRIAEVLRPLLDDMSDEVKIAALTALGPLRHEPAREPMLRLLTAPDTARRVQMAAITAISESGFGVQGFREKVEEHLPPNYFVDKAGIIKKRS